MSKPVANAGGHAEKLPGATIGRKLEKNQTQKLILFWITLESGIRNYLILHLPVVISLPSAKA